MKFVKHKATAERVIKDIRRKMRKHHSAEAIIHFAGLAATRRSCLLIPVT